MTTSVQAVDYTSFIFAQGEELKTNSLKIAEAFGKMHKHVLRDIERTISQTAELLNAPKFGLVDYLDAKGENRKMYEMNKDGFMLVVMGYSGEAAMKIKVAYINAFNFMLAKLKPVPNALRDLPPQTLTPAMLRHIEKRIAHLNKTQVGSTYASLGRMIKEKFNVNERKAIPIHKYREVCALLGCEPDEKALQGELVEPAKLEYQPPKGMVLIAESELAEMKKSPKATWSNYASMTLALPHESSRILVSMNNGVTSLFEIPDSYLIGNVESLTRQLKQEGYHLVKDNPQNKLETIEKIVSAKFEA